MRSWGLEEKDGRPGVAPGEREWGAKGADDELNRQRRQIPKTGLHSLVVVKGGKFGPCVGG